MAGGTTGMPSCILTTKATEGLYYLDLTKIHRDITDDRSGIPVRLRTTVVNTANGCQPLENAAADIWHCDAVHSGFTEQSESQGGGGGALPPPGEAGQYGPPPEAGGPEAGNEAAQKTDNTRFLRGVQLTNADGVAEFDTIYPGW